MSGIVATIIGLVAVPTIMAANNWDDHNRHDRRMARDFAINFLESCPPNAIYLRKEIMILIHCGMHKK
ncbi:MAG: hypothetical protein R2728_06010 [Chitinophagales bacterium]